MHSYFVGSKLKPTFLVEIEPKKKIISIYKPDKYSAKLDFYEKYSLGLLLITIKYNNIIFLEKPILYKQKHHLVNEMIIKIDDKYFLLSNKGKTTLSSL